LSLYLPPHHQPFPSHAILKSYMLALNADRANSSRESASFAYLVVVWKELGIGETCRYLFVLFSFCLFFLLLPLTFKPSDGTHDCHTLIHYYFSNVEIGGDPRLCGFVVCDFVFVYTRALCVKISNPSYFLSRRVGVGGGGREVGGGARAVERGGSRGGKLT
jgi:hypothetical protein